MQKSTRPKIHVCLGFFFLVSLVCLNGFAQDPIPPTEAYTDGGDKAVLPDVDEAILVDQNDGTTKAVPMYEYEQQVKGESAVTSEDPETAAKQAADAAETITGDPNDGTIEVVYEAEAVAPYRDRRSNWSGLFGINLTRMKPTKYRSRIEGDTNSYSAMFGDSATLNLVQITLGPKYNFSAGSFYGEIALGTGAVSGTLNNTASSFNGESRNLELQKYGLQFGLVFDNIFPEPYVAPYFSGQIFGFNYKEKATGTETTGKTAPTTGYTLGALLLLDWLDPDAALRAINSGVENTYLDVYVSQLNTSNSEADPRLETSFDLGVGLKVEY